MKPLLTLTEEDIRELSRWAKRNMRGDEIDLLMAWVSRKIDIQASREESEAEMAAGDSKRKEASQQAKVAANGATKAEPHAA
jgi:hypothetical protein